MENIYIQIIDGEGKSSYHHIPFRTTLTIGKSETCDIKIRGKEALSVHALIEAYDQNSISIRSLSQKGNVLLNGKPVEKAQLSFSDIIKIGNYEFQIKKVDVHDSFQEPWGEAKKEEKGFSEIFKTPISDDEIEHSIYIPESSAPKEIQLESKTEEIPIEKIEAVKSDTQALEELPTIKESTSVREIVRSSHSLRIKEYWWDVLISDNIYPLTHPVTIGSSRKNTFIVPQNGLPKKFSLFVFENFEPNLIFNKQIDGFVVANGEKIKIHEPKGKLKISSHRDDNAKLKLELDDRGEISHGNIRFAFEFVTTPAPASTYKLFAKMDRIYKRALLLGLIFFIMFLAFFFVISPPSIVIAKRPEIKIIPGAILTPAKKPTPPPKPLVARAGSSQSTEGAGAKAGGTEGKRGKSTQGPKGPTIQDLIQREGIGALMAFKSSNAFRNIAVGGGGDLKNATGKLRAGLPGETEIRDGKGLKGIGKGGGNPNAFAGSIGGLGTKGNGLGKEGTGRGDFGKKGEARITAGSIEGEESSFFGDMDPAIIERLIKANIGYIKWCYEKELNQKPDLEGKIVVDFIIGVDGLVTSSKVKASSMSDENVESCVTRRIKNIMFPKPGSGIVQVFYPFMFRMAGGF